MQRGLNSDTCLGMRLHSCPGQQDSCVRQHCATLPKGRADSSWLGKGCLHTHPCHPCKRQKRSVRKHITGRGQVIIEQWSPSGALTQEPPKCYRDPQRLHLGSTTPQTPKSFFPFIGPMHLGESSRGCGPELWVHFRDETLRSWKCRGHSQESAKPGPKSWAALREVLAEVRI